MQRSTAVPTALQYVPQRQAPSAHGVRTRADLSVQLRAQCVDMVDVDGHLHLEAHLHVLGCARDA
eukprot:6173960-Pleurochrysis_carterae.AAC.1